VAAYTLPETVEGKQAGGRGAALHLQDGREASAGLPGTSRLVQLARQEQVACADELEKSLEKSPETCKRGR